MWQMQPNSTQQPEPVGICLLNPPLAPSQPPHLVPISRLVFVWRENKLLLRSSLEVPNVFKGRQTTVGWWGAQDGLLKMPPPGFCFLLVYLAGGVGGTPDCLGLLLRQRSWTWAAKFHHDHVLATDGCCEDPPALPARVAGDRLWVEQGSHQLWVDVETISRPWVSICLIQP